MQQEHQRNTSSSIEISEARQNEGLAMVLKSFKDEHIHLPAHPRRAKYADSKAFTQHSRGGR